MTILVVDDNSAHRYSLCQSLREAEFITEEAKDAGTALQRAGMRPDLVLMDLHLPDMTGFEVCRKLKANPETQAIPVVLFSSMSQNAAAVNDALQVGAATFLFFPMTSNELVAVVRGTLARSHNKGRK